MNFGELQSTVSYWLDDLQFGYFTSTQVKLWLNNAQKEVQKQLLKAGQNYYLKVCQTNMVYNQTDYVLPQDFKKLNRLEVVVNGVAPTENKQIIMPITTNQQDLIQQAPALPRFYSLKRDRLVLYPAPDSTYLMRLFYSYQVADMTLDTDIPDVPEAYHEYIALLAAEDGFIKDGRTSELLSKKIATYKGDLLEDSQERTLDGPRNIVETGNDYASGFFF